MSEHRSFRDWRQRPSTWFERERAAEFQEAGVADVFVEPADAPREFWDSVMLSSERLLPVHHSESLQAWADEMRYMTGTPFTCGPEAAYPLLVVQGTYAAEPTVVATLGLRLAGVELMMDIARQVDEFAVRVNDRANYFRVGLRIERGRFVGVQHEHMHTELVRPTLLLIARPGLEAVDELYRKAFERALSNDPSGAVTAASSAVEEMLKAAGAGGSTLERLVQSARSSGWLGNAEGEIAKKLMALRGESDAHGTGTTEFDRAMFAIHLASAILLHVSRAAPLERD